MKRCTGCKQLLDESKFWRNNHHRDGLGYRCIECKKEYKRVWDEENREELRAKANEYNRIHRKYRREQYRRWREHRHLLVIQVYSDLDIKCALCGEEDIDVLSIDHINGGGVSHLKTIPNSDLYAWLINSKYPDGFRVLCWNCQHREKLRLQDKEIRERELLEFQDEKDNKVIE